VDGAGFEGGGTAATADDGSQGAAYDASGDGPDNGSSGTSYYSSDDTAGDSPGSRSDDTSGDRSAGILARRPPGELVLLSRYALSGHWCLV
jgi:hypothetical protein